ncbi:hypothetical protein [Roseobacter sp. AzwK-3b]|uniref:hypothetical protein n=1 Tax=Roseobacter sp. AzwK-3b TaxID=351016 RepID=UPI0012F4A7AC|nr:hypothetical protein [Roseobacter sp. AzwK-3b]
MSNNRKDSGRINLVTSFICTECGENLDLAFDQLGKPAPKASTSFGMGGAYVLENRVHVHPCRTCIEKEVAPARMIAAALAELKAETDDQER